jgi:uncharacterized protein YndB with AHSA1/START domain
MTQSVKKTVVVEAGQARAFKVFTEQIDAWWPREYKIGQTAMKRAVLEPRTGGRWYEQDEDGTECNWGKVLAYEPPGRLVLAWQITGTWQFDANFVTEVEVRFISEGEKRTRVELEHRNLDRYGPGASEARNTYDSPNGWGGVLGRFSEQVAKEA